MLNTFFFGYLAKKWKRLIRVLSFLGLAFLLLAVTASSDGFGSEVYPFGYTIETEEYLVVVLLYVNLVSLISWVLKPFITND